MSKKIIKLFLRLAIGIGFISPVLDRFGIWGNTWGDWGNFVNYVQSLLPWLTGGWIQVAAIAATLCEIVFGIFLIIGWKVRFFANLSGGLMLLFAMAMWTSSGIKAPLNASVFAASAASFGLATIRVKFLEI